ncbi:MAG: hypothetical protein ABEJ08_05415 [Halobacteriaceae archaeon]
MSEFTEEERRILDHLRQGVDTGQRYFRSRNIADRLGLTAKQVGARLPELAEKADEISIEKWGRSRATTWRVEPA